MIRSYFKIAWRNLRNKIGFSIINITGLAVGMAGAILIYLWVQNEFSFDQFHANKNTLYKVWNRTAGPGEKYCFDVTAGPIASALKTVFPEIKSAARIYWSIDRLFNYGDHSLKAKGNDVDKDFLTMFTFPFIKGNPNHALDNVNDVVITEGLARKLFGNADPINKVVKLNNTDVYKVTGVIKDLPNNTQFDFEYLVSLAAYEKNYGGTQWQTNSFYTFVQLQPTASVNAVDKKIKHLILQHDPKAGSEIFLHPLRQWHLYSNFENGKVAGGRIKDVRLLMGIAAIILFIACINFMNLSTAQSQKRAREVGVRKVIGANRISLISQFLSESILLALIAGLIALILAQLCLPWFNQLTEKKLFINYTDPVFWLMFTGFILITGLLAGSYPAFLLSGFKPVKVLKGTLNPSHSAFNPRKALVVVQFSVAIILVVSTIVIYRQIKFAQEKDKGYNISNLIEIPIEGDIDKNYQVIKNQLLSSGIATAICRTSLGVTNDGAHSNGIWDGKHPDQQSLDFSRFGTSGDFVKTMGLKLLDGRDIDLVKHPADSAGCMLNETAVKQLHLQDPIGKFVTQSWTGGSMRLQIIGVFKDFIIKSPYVNVNPMIVYGSKTWSYNTLIKLNGRTGISKGLQTAEEIFKKNNPAYPFTYQFVDQQYEQKFNDEKKQAQLATVFAGLTILISCLGLFGLAAYMAENRSKEIGIRKVLGASVGSITTMLTTEFVTLVIIAIIIATPIAWWAMNKWLQSYSYRIEIGWLTFVLAGLTAVVIAVLTVSMQSIKAALANPVKSIRTE